MRTRVYRQKREDAPQREEQAQPESSQELLDKTEELLDEIDQILEIETQELTYRQHLELWAARQPDLRRYRQSCGGCLERLEKLLRAGYRPLMPWETPPAGVEVVTLDC